MNEAQKKVVVELKAAGDLEDMVGFKDTPNELYIYHEGGEKITAVHRSGIVTIHHHKRAS